MLHISDHPLIQREITTLRDASTPPEDFRRALRRVAQLLAYEVTMDLTLVSQSVHTPLEETEGWKLARPVILVPVLRAGLGMVEAFLDIIPDARVGHIGLYRDEETLQPVEYYTSYPDAIGKSCIFLLDPMLATGGSAVAAIRILRTQGATDIRLISLVSAPEGVDAVHEAYPGTHIHTAVLDRGLNEKGYIVPGLGDAGDRIFGTGRETG